MLLATAAATTMLGEAPLRMVLAVAAHTARPSAANTPQGVLSDARFPLVERRQKPCTVTTMSEVMAVNCEAATVAAGEAAPRMVLTGCCAHCMSALEHTQEMVFSRPALVQSVAKC